ncbi:MAG: type IV secretory system conjugative DNA transfer family protein [Chloroflexi bacterium]|nr:type IV secretory system conjugative DNA transfer family protein [Chloroflexota bacterium]
MYAADASKPIGLNILDDASTPQRHLVVSGVISIFAHLYGHNWQHRQEHILRNALFALLDQETRHTLLSVYRLLIDASFRKQVIAGIKDPMVKTFWLVEYPRYLFSKSDALVTLLNKLGGFLTVPLVRGVVGKATSDIDFRDLMDRRKILLLNLSKGRLGEDNAAFLGALVLLKLQLAAMGRADTPEHKRNDFYVYVDEAQSFVGVQGIDHLLSEARKYRLCLTMSHQYLGQLNDEMRQAIFGNVGTTVCFAVGPEDAGTLEKEFSPSFTRQDLVDQPKHHIYLRLAIDGKSSRPFSAVTLPPLAFGGRR